VSSEDLLSFGFGECAPIWGLSTESKPEVERAIARFDTLLKSPSELRSTMLSIPSLRFALETALFDLSNGGVMKPFDVNLSKPIPINGLVWMADIETMLMECRNKIENGFRTVKFKIGAHDFDQELDMLRKVRSEFDLDDLEIRLDANGAFDESDCLDKLDRLTMVHPHSIEQPIRAGRWDAHAELCRRSPIPIALDEELIGIHDVVQKRKLLDTIQPAFLVLKPSLHGGFSGSDEWIALAAERSIGWWATSALESNVGLNAIAQWVLTKEVTIPQGLGTGGLFSNNIASPWIVSEGQLRYDYELKWNLKPINA
jgi:L-alanine-DL-glutamate epimerase-like enolase superfamily enzyme